MAITPTYPLTIMDTFSRTLSSDWGTSDTGHAWSSETESRWTTINSAAEVSMLSNDAAFYDSAVIGSSLLASSESLLKLNFISTAATPFTDAGPIMRRTADNNFYMVRVRNNDNLISIAINKAGAWTNLKSVSYTLSKNTVYWVRTRTDGSGIHCKVWKYGTVEPSSWTIEAPFSVDGPTKGQMGFAVRRTSSTYTARLGVFYGYYLPDVASATMPVVDTFARDVVGGWGINTLKQPWEGDVNEDPFAYARVLAGGVSSTTGAATLSHTGDGDTAKTAAIGPLVSGNAESFVKFSINTAAAGVNFRIGLRGNTQYTAGAMDYTGYYVRVATVNTTFAPFKKTAFGTGGTAITPTTNTAFTALVANTVYCVRFQIIGTTLQAKLWIDGTTEPGTWNLVATDSSITGSGRFFVNYDQTAGQISSRTVSIYDMSYSQTTTGTPPTTTGAFTVVSKTDTSISVRAAFSNDSDADNSVTFWLREVGTGYWTQAATGTTTRVASPLSWTNTISNLKPNTTYDLEARFVDPDDVLGTNPVALQVTTNNAGIAPGVVTVTGVTAASVNIVATYLDDADSDSTAAVDYRITSQTQYGATDDFNGLPETLLENHTPDIGGAWFRHPSYEDDDSAIIWSSSIYSKQQSIAFGSFGSFNFPEYLVYYNASALGKDQTVKATIKVPDYAALEERGEFFVDVTGRNSVGLIARANSVSNTMYVVTHYRSLDSDSWELYEINNGVVAGSGLPIITGTFELVPNAIHELVFSCTDEAKIFFIDGIEVFRTTSNNLSPASSYAGVLFIRHGLEEPSPENSIQFPSFEATYRINNPTWVSAGAMTADRVLKQFTKTISSLTSDTTYEFRVTYTDADGIHGTSAAVSAVTTTMGAAIRLNVMTAIVRATSIVIETTYLFDTNNNSVLSIQYRPLYDNLWTTIPPALITVNRGSKKFTGLLPSLRPNTTYEIQAIVTDADGIDGPTFLSSTVTTKGPQDDFKKESKHYLWKVYNNVEKYITTWHDAGTPEFAWHENGGVSDLTVVLPRKIASVNDANSGIAHQNRVDIWAVDPSSNGFGPNLVIDNEFNLGSWTLGSNATISTNGGPDDSASLHIVSAVTSQVVTRSTPILLYRQPISGGTTSYPVPLVAESLAKASGSKLTLFVEAYDVNDVKLDTSNTVDTVGSAWQTIRVEYMPPPKTYYVRVCFRNDAKGDMYADKVSLRPKELLIYRGRIESYTPRLEQDGEDITVEILGLVSLLSDDYIEFLQFVDIQPQKDSVAGRITYGASDPGEMLKMIIDRAQRQNPQFALYYTNDSIHNTGQVAEYTFRDQQIRACMDKIRNLCPPGWHYYVEADGLVVLRGPEHAETHNLRIGVEIMNFSVERSIRNLKNYIEVKGRQDEDESEPDGHGSIKYITFDQASIKKYGKRMLFIRDSNITTPSTAELIGEGRLDEYNREEQRGECLIPDDKSLYYVGNALKGDNIEKYRPGDNVFIYDPLTEPRQVFWDQMIWDKDAWDANVTFVPLPESVPIKTVQYQGESISVEVSERQPSGTSDFGRLYRYLQLKDAEDDN